MKRPSLRADYESGEGSAVVPDEWCADNPLLRADILQDWISDLEAAYDDALDEYKAELETLPKGKPSADDIAWVKKFQELNPHLADVTGIPKR